MGDADDDNDHVDSFIFLGISFFFWNFGINM